MGPHSADVMSAVSSADSGLRKKAAAVDTNVATAEVAAARPSGSARTMVAPSGAPCRRGDMSAQRAEATKRHAGGSTTKRQGDLGRGSGRLRVDL